MSTATQTSAEIQRLVRLFLPHCKDRDTMLALDVLAVEPTSWSQGHALFQTIRSRTLAAERTGDRLGAVQCLFEEACAKTLYNLSGCAAPFDSDSSDWVRPNALALAKVLGIPDPASEIGLGAQPNIQADAFGAA